MSEYVSNLVAWQFMSGRTKWKHRDIPSRLRYADNCIRLIDGYHPNHVHAHDLETATGAIQNGVQMLWVYRFDNVDVKTLFERLKGNSTLLSLNVDDCAVDAEAARILSDAVEENTTLLYLSICHANIGNEGVGYVSDMLRVNSTLLFLTLIDCHFYCRGYEFLSNALKENSTLLYLDISVNDSSDDGPKFLADMLRENSTLLSLTLYQCEIRDVGAKHLTVDVLQENSALLYLELNGNKVSDYQNIRVRKFLEARRDELSFDLRSGRQCQDFLELLLGISSWTVSRNEHIPYFNEQLPSEVWGDILSFLSDDDRSLQESFLVSDVRSGFLSPPVSLSFAARDLPLLRMIPAIEGHFRSDHWTTHRLFRVGDDEK